MKRYRIEIFDRSLAFRTFAEISEPTIALDKLVLSQSEVECFGRIECSRGDFAQIRIDGTVEYQGIISDIVYDGAQTSLTLESMDSLLDNEVFADVSLLGSQDIETWMTDILSDYFDGSDTFQNLPDVQITALSSTTGSYTTSDTGAYNMYDLMTHMFKIYGSILTITFDPTDKQITFTFTAINTSKITKLDVNVTDVQSFSLENSVTADHVNKMTVRNAEDRSQSLTFYWHPTEFGGSVDTDSSTNRQTPVRTACTEIVLDEGQTFADAAYTEAYQAMYNSRYDDLITLVFNAESKLMPVGNLGDLYTLIDGDTAYNTMLTGIRVLNMYYVEMTFGYVRKRLTQIIKMDRRNK